MSNRDYSSETDMSRLLETSLPPKPIQRGDVVEGEVVQIDQEGLVVSLGLKTEGMVPQQEMRSLSPEESRRLRRGDTVQVMVLGEEDSGGMTLLSIDQAQIERTWRELQERLDNGSFVTGKITGSNRGGVVVDIRGIQGFVPFSQMAPIAATDNRDDVAASRAGEQTDFQVIEVDSSQGRLVLSERAVWRMRQEEARDRFLLELEEGTILQGKVKSVREFGVFVELSQLIDGLVPISELSWGMVRSADEVVNLGDEVDVYVLRVELESRRITLSMRRAQPDPWLLVDQKYDVDQVVQGTVTRIVPFGAFVNLEDGVEGLIHISELSMRRVRHPKECVYQGQKVRVRVLNIDSTSRRISLSYKQVFE